MTAITPVQRPISIHAPREGCDRFRRRSCTSGCYFNPRTPRGVRLHTAESGRSWDSRISIHAPREGCDQRNSRVVRRRSNFNPRTPRGVRRTPTTPASTGRSDFNPRTPRGVRRIGIPNCAARSKFQSTHPARGATLKDSKYRDKLAISIHAPREGCDLRLDPVAYPGMVFQSTHPARGATPRAEAHQI